MNGSEVFDFIIVGAGSAGCVLANKLSANPSHRVLLLEAGGSDFNFWVRMPIGYGKTFYHPTLNWRYLSEPVPGIGDRRSYWPRGKVLGGSSSINAMVYIRGQYEDFDAWAALGNPGWSATDVVPVYKRMEDNLEGGNDWRGAGGPLTVTSMKRAVHPLADEFLRACAAAGLPLNDDFNGRSQEGAGVYQVTTRNGLRCSSANAYLHPVRGRKNLEIRTGAHVTRLLFDGKRASGVDYVRDGQTMRASVCGELILSAGAVNSPKLLMLSGVGDPDRLSAHGIVPVHTAPGVGRNLQDHFGFDHVYEANRPTLNDVLRPLWSRLAVGAQYLLTRKGPLSLSVNQAGGFVRSRAGLNRPNLQLYFSPLSYTRAIPGKRALMRTDLFSGFMMGASNCHPLSRGEITLRSADPFDAPVIRPNYLSEEADVVELLESARILRALAAAGPMAGVIKREVQPGLSATTDRDLIADIRARGGSIFHACGTCSMGSDPARAVVELTAAGSWHGGIARCGRLHFPANPLGQHQCARDHGRRARGGVHSRRR